MSQTYQNKKKGLDLKINKSHFINKNYLKNQSFNQKQFFSLEKTFHKRNHKTMLEKSIEYNIKLLDNKQEVSQNLLFNSRHYPDIKYQTCQNLGYLRNTAVTCLIHNKNKQNQQKQVYYDDLKLKFNESQKMYIKKVQDLKFLQKNIIVKPIKKKHSNDNLPRDIQKNDDKKQQKLESNIYNFLLPNPDPEVIGIINTNPLKPTTLLYSSMICLQNKIYIYGGRSSILNKYLYELNLQEFTWTRHLNQKNIPFSLYGNQALPCGSNQFYVFGGETPQNNTRFEQFQEMIDSDKPIIVRDVCNNLNQYDSSSNQWTQVMAQYPPAPRRNHGSCIIANKFLFVYGGINKKGKFLSDVNILNLETLIWEKIEIEGDLDGQNGIAFHSILYIQKTDYNIKCIFNPLPEIKKDQSFQKLKEQGIFAFGGKKQCGNSSGRFKVCRIGQQPLQWNTVKGLGKVPMKRYQHTMNYIEQTMTIVIHGGYSEQVGSALNDIHLFSLQSLEWQEVNKLGNKLQPRIGHSACSFKTTLFIFGGLDSTQHLNSEINIIELDRAILRSQNQISDQSPIYVYKKGAELQSQNVVTSHQVSHRQSQKRQSLAKKSNQTNKDEYYFEDLKSFIPIPTKKQLKQ